MKRERRRLITGELICPDRVNCRRWFRRASPLKQNRFDPSLASMTWGLADRQQGDQIMLCPAQAVRLTAVLALFSSLLWGQKLEIQPHDQRAILRVETAPDHLTVIELSDPVTMVAVGNPAAFMVERRDNKVLVKPHEE